MAAGMQQDGPEQPGRPGTPKRAQQEPRPGILIARPFGIAVYVSPWWFLVAAVLVVGLATSDPSPLPATDSGPVPRYLLAVAFIVLLYLSVLIHELSHSLVARGFGLPVRRILLYPLGGYSEIDEPPTPGKEFLVSAAGPAMSFALAGIANAVNVLATTHGIARALIDFVIYANVLVGVFNLLPGLPLDGGRILRAGVWKVTGKAVYSTVVAAWAGRIIAVAIVGVVFLSRLGGQFSFASGYGIWPIAIAVFIWISASQTLRSAKVRERLPAIQARALARRAIPIPQDLPLAEAIRRAELQQARALVVVDHDARPIAIVDEGKVLDTPEQRRPWIDAGSLARTLDPDMILSADLSGMDLIEAVQRSPASEYLLVEPSGQVYGVLAAADLQRAFASVRA